jgi:hypothetical protein
MRTQNLFSCLVMALNMVVVTSIATPVAATPVMLINATATVEQGGFPVTNTYSIDGQGWATSSSPSIAFYQAATPITWVNNQYTFQLASTTPFGNHVLGKFRLSYTSDPGPLGLASNWTQFTPTLATAVNSNPVTIYPTNIIQATDVNANNDTITVTADLLSYAGVTGFRLEAIQDATGPYIGPGIPGNNNFVLDAFLIDIIQLPPPPAPEPASAILWGIGMFGLTTLRRQRLRAKDRESQVSEQGLGSDL